MFPGESVEYVQSTLTKVIDDPNAQLKLIYQPVPSDASPLRDDVMKALRKAIDLRAPRPADRAFDVGRRDRQPVLPERSACRATAWAACSCSSKDSFSHGLNERIPVDSIDGAVVQWRSLIKDLSR